MSTSELTRTTEPDGMAQCVQVAVGVVQDKAGRILIARRPESAHQGGLWEFPGGKLERAETVLQALDRELFEELDIRVESTSPLIEIVHNYPDKQVCLHVHKVDSWRGQVRGKEGQPVCWVTPKELGHYPFPAANYPILNALQLPEHCLITGDFENYQDFADRLQRALDSSGVSMVQVRAHQLSQTDYEALAGLACRICQSRAVSVVLNHASALSLAPKLGAAGVHLTAQQLMGLTARPDQALVGASCHSGEELARAGNLGINYAFLSPVKPTASHPGARPLGWDRFADLTRRARLPVYALGGLGPEDLPAPSLLAPRGLPLSAPGGLNPQIHRSEHWRPRRGCGDFRWPTPLNRLTCTARNKRAGRGIARSNTLSSGRSDRQVLSFGNRYSS